MALHGLHYKERDKLAVDLVRAAVQVAYDLGSDVFPSPREDGIVSTKPLRRMALTGGSADYLEHGKIDCEVAYASLGKLFALARDTAHQMGGGDTMVSLDNLLYLIGKLEGKHGSAAIVKKVHP